MEKNFYEISAGGTMLREGDPISIYSGAWFTGESVRILPHF